LFERVEIGQGAVVHKAILDKEVVVEPGATVGVDRELDLQRGFTVSEGGVTVVPKGTVITA
jgi:glucose-1-phosphate adenylyltransferase